jgi:hypothetical protein
MSNNKHTTGLWRWETDGNNGDQWLYGDTPILRRIKAREIKKGDHALIEAAPILLEAAELGLEYVKKYAESVVFDSNLQAAICKIEIAIKKAKGE